MRLWDLKPQLFIGFFAASIALLGDTVVGVRLAGLLSVTAVGSLVFIIGERLWGRPEGMVAGALSILFISTMPGGQATLSEIVALVPGMAAAWVLIRAPLGLRGCFFVGLLLGMAGLFRSNWVLVAGAVGLWILFGPQARERSAIRGTAAYIAGGLGAVWVVALPYLATGKATLFVEAVFLAPLRYSQDGASMLEALRIQVGRGVGLDTALLLIGAVGWAGAAMRPGRTSPELRRNLELLGLLFAAVLVSILLGGETHEHYVLQLVPFLSLAGGAFWIQATRRSTGRWIAAVTVVLGSAIALEPVATEYASVIGRVVNGQSLFTDPGYELAAFLRSANPQGDPMYLASNHIAHWLSGTRPIAKSVTHPSNIARQSLLGVIPGAGSTPALEMERILALEPRFVVKDQVLWYLDDRQDARDALRRALAERYRLVKEIGSTQVYELRRGRHGTSR